MVCRIEHSTVDKIIKDLPMNKGGIGRYKCAACAYEKGLENGEKENSVST